MKKIILLFCFLMLIIPSLLAQSRLVKITSLTKVCTLEGDEKPKDRYVRPPSTEAEKTIDAICRKIGVTSKGFIIEAADVKNAEALIINNKRYIHYNPFYINKIKQESQTNRAIIFVLAHEIGHHINAHALETTDVEKRKEEELEADYFAGCALAHINATLEDLEKAVSILSENGDEKHPPRSARLMSATSGWEDCQPKIKPKEPAPPVQKPDAAIECFRNNTGDVYFKNASRATIRIHLSLQSGWYEQFKYITVEPNETKGFLSLKAGVTYFAIRISDGSQSFRDYKNEELRIERCADKSQEPIIVR
jgi:IrrE N-terminal-like domain